MKRTLRFNVSGSDSIKLQRIEDAYSDVNTTAKVLRILIRDKYLELERGDLDLDRRITESFSRKVPKCSHFMKKHYAKGLCKYCYDVERSKIPVDCIKCKNTIPKSDADFNTVTRKYTCKEYLKCLNNKELNVG